VLVLTAPLTVHSPISLPLLGPAYSLSHNNTDIKPINNTIMASTCSSKRESHTSLTLNQKLEMIEFSEEVMSKAKIG